MRASRLFVTMEAGALHYALIFLALLPARVAYSLGRIAGDVQFQIESSKRKMILECLDLAFGERLGPQGRILVARDTFRLGTCNALDRLRLGGNGRGLAKLVEARGLEHIGNALDRGRGAVIASAHFGSFELAQRLLGVFGLTLIAYEGNRGRLSFGQMLVRPVELTKALRTNILSRYLRPSIYVDKGRRSTAVVKAAKVLSRNELVWVMLDLIDSPARHPNAIPTPFLNGMTYFPTGAVRIAKANGAPLLICLIHRSPDYRHQVLEISAPITTEGEVDEVNRRCARVIENAILSQPAHWRTWNYRKMASIGLVPEGKANRFVRVGGAWVPSE